MKFDANRLFSFEGVYRKPSAWTEHIPFAYFLMEKFRPKSFVELGTHMGTSYFSFCKAVKLLGLQTKCYAVDSWEGDEHSGLYGEHVYDEVKKYNESHFGSFSSLLRMEFDEALGSFLDHSIDLLHIDGFHNYEAVKHDFYSWLPKMSAKSMVVMHDTQVKKDDFGVWRLFEELSADFPSFEFVHGHGLGLLITGKEQAGFFQGLFEAASQEFSYEELFSVLGERLHFKYQNHELSLKLTQLQDNVAELQSAVHQAQDAFNKSQSALAGSEEQRRQDGSEYNEARLKQRNIINSLKEKLAEKEEGIRKLEKTLKKKDERITKIIFQNRQHENMIFSQKDRIQALLNQGYTKVDSVAGLQARIDYIKNSRSWRYTHLFRYVFRKIVLTRQMLSMMLKLFFYSFGNKKDEFALLFNELKSISIIRRSSLFDYAFYYDAYPDVADSNADGIIHYVRQGAAEGRKPNKDFETTAYVRNNPDIRDYPLNPFVHYILHGRKEERKAF